LFPEEILSKNMLVLVFAMVSLPSFFLETKFQVDDS
jgi:hypothetical protein